MVTYGDEAAIKTAVADVRNDASDCDWMVAAHDKVDVVSLRGSGSGGLDALKAALQANEIAFALLRVTNKFDDSVTVKFVFIHWLGPEVKMITKGRSAVHRGEIETLFSPYHVSIVDQSDIDEITQDIVMTKVQDVAGTRSHVTERKAGDQERGFTQTSTERRGNTAPTAVPSPSRPAPATDAGNEGGGDSTVDAENPPPPAQSKPVAKPALRPPVVSSQGAAVSWDPAIAAAIADVRNDASAVNWAIATYAEGGVENVILLGSGEGGIEEMNTKFTPDMVAYAIFRTTEKIDDTVAVKFGHISWIGDNFRPMLRAKVSTHRSSVRDVFEPFHVEFAGVSAVDEVTPELIARAIGQASGTLSHVK